MSKYSFEVGDKVISPTFGVGRVVRDDGLVAGVMRLVVKYEGSPSEFGMELSGKYDGCQVIYPVNIDIIKVGPMTLDTTVKPDASEPQGFEPSATYLHDAIEDVVERQEEIDRQVVKSALSGERGPDQQRIAEEVIRFGSLLLRKNRDYGCGVWESPVLVPNCDPKTAILVRMSDKINRIAALSELGSPEVAESFNDTLRDLGAYCLLELSRPAEATE